QGRGVGRGGGVAGADEAAHVLVGAAPRAQGRARTVGVARAQTGRRLADARRDGVERGAGRGEPGAQQRRGLGAGEARGQAGGLELAHGGRRLGVAALLLGLRADEGDVDDGGAIGRGGFAKRRQVAERGRGRLLGLLRRRRRLRLRRGGRL